jgi:hypothetical protein
VTFNVIDHLSKVVREAIEIDLTRKGAPSEVEVTLSLVS